MRHVVLTCKNHPHLRWSCKEIAFEEGNGGYNGRRTLFFNGQATGKFYDWGAPRCVKTVEGALIEECSCPASDLVKAPEDAKAEQLYLDSIKSQ